MNLARAVAIIKRDLGHALAGDQDIIDAIGDAQEQMETSWTTQPLPWFLYSERAVVTSPGDEERLLLPDDFIMETEQDTLWMQLEGGGEVPLKKYDMDDLRTMTERWTDMQHNQAEVRGRYSYALTGDYFRIFPKPLVSKSYKMLYYKKQPIVTAPNDTNKWLTHAPWVLIGSAGEEIAVGKRDGLAKGHFQSKKAAAIESITIFSNERQIANRRMAMGETL